MSTETEVQPPPNSEPASTPEQTNPTSTEAEEKPASLISGEAKPEPAPEPEPALDAEKLSSLLPEGYQLDDTLAPKFLETLNGFESREDLATKMLAFHKEMLEAADASANAAWDATQDAWKNEVKADPEFGGDKLETSLATARTLIETYAKDQAEAKAIKEFFDLTGAGSSIHMVRLLNRLAKAIPGEAKPVEGTPAATDKTRADKLFGAV